MNENNKFSRDEMKEAFLEGYYASRDYSYDRETAIAKCFNKAYPKKLRTWTDTDGQVLRYNPDRNNVEYLLEGNWYFRYTSKQVQEICERYNAMADLIKNPMEEE